ncbi:MAG: hypothetical protein JNJ54_24105 [Myxococcaceae bacterium]|nr:hypothetical protein [Myxococcaceae bacterium]
MTARVGKGPSRAFLGCGAVVTLAVVTCGWCGVRTSRDLIEFKRFEHTPAGTRVEAVMTSAAALGFERAPEADQGPDDAGVATLGLVRRNGPPVGSWFLHVHHLDGGVSSVTTWIPD